MPEHLNHEEITLPLPSQKRNYVLEAFICECRDRFCIMQRMQNLRLLAKILSILPVLHTV